MNEIAYFCPPKPPYGKSRRKIIVDWFNANPSGRLYVNCEYRPQLKDDTDLRYLIKKDFLTQQREPANRGSKGSGYRSLKFNGIQDMYKSSSGRNTYLIKTAVN